MTTCETCFDFIGHQCLLAKNIEAFLSNEHIPSSKRLETRNEALQRATTNPHICPNPEYLLSQTGPIQPNGK